MRIDVVGPGAVGGTLAVRLASAGEDVHLVARPAASSHVALRLRDAHGVREAQLPAGPATRPDADLVLLAVKTQDVSEAARRIRPGPGAVVVLANGLAADGLASRALPGRRLVPAVVVFDATSLAPGAIDVHRDGGLLVPLHSPAEVDALRAACVVERRLDFEGARWTKLLVNLGNGLNAATGLPAQEAFRGVGARIGVRLLAEGLRAAERSGVALAPIPWVHPRLPRLLARLPEGLAASLLALRVRRTFAGAPAYGSTLQSLRRGRPTEVRYLNGAVSEIGRSRGVPTPANDAVVAAVERAEKGGGFTAAEELWRTIRRGAGPRAP